MIADAWFRGNDMIVRLDLLRSSTASTSSYIASSTGVSLHLWKTLTTASTANRLTTAALNVPYLSVSGRYQLVVGSTAGSPAASITSTMRGLAILTVAHSGLNGEFRVRWRGEDRGTT
jgi:hypothetical protein